MKVEGTCSLFAKLTLTATMDRSVCICTGTFEYMKVCAQKNTLKTSRIRQFAQKRMSLLNGYAHFSSNEKIKKQRKTGLTNKERYTLHYICSKQLV